MMRTRLTKVLALILALVMTIGLLPMSAMADEAGLAGISGEYTYNGVTAKVHAPDGAFPDGTTLSIKPVVDTQETKTIQDAIENAPDVAPVTDMVAFDISFLNAEGVELQPNAGYTVDVSFDVAKNEKMKDAQQADALSVVHMEEQPNGETKPVEMDTKKTEQKDAVSVDAESFSIYVVAANPVVTYTFYDKDGSKLTVDNAVQIVKNGDTLYEPTAPAVDGKSFAGWYTAETEGDLFNGFGTQSGITAASAASVDLYARYTDGYSVYFWNADGTKIMHTETVADHVAHNFSTVTYDVDSTHAVVGWATENDRTVDVSAVVTVPEGQTSLNLYAIVNAGFWVNFDSNGGSPVASIFALEGNSVTNLAAPTRSGYSFAGWFSASDLTGDNVTTVSSSQTLYAKWTPNDTGYSIIYWIENADDANYSFVKKSNGNGKVGSVITLDSTQTSISNLDTNDRNYFTFKNYDEGKTISEDGSTIVNVYYSRKSFTLTFKVDGYQLYLYCCNDYSQV
jgi:uncharacterized repeat protein (TIGR02543 family)